MVVVVDKRQLNLFSSPHKPLLTYLRAHQVTLQFNLVSVTGLLPVFASLSVYCLWMEIKHGSVAGVGKPDKMLTSTAAGVLPKTPTQGSHQCRPVATYYNYLQLYSTPFFFPFCHSVHTWDKVSVSVCPFAVAFR